jgi:hypothetical protein
LIVINFGPSARLQPVTTKPITVAAIFGGSFLVRRERYQAFIAGKSFDLDEPQLAGIGIERGDVVAEILFMNVRNYTALRSLVFA